MKQSGFGRELGMAALDGYTRSQERVHLDGRLKTMAGRLEGKVCVITGAGGGMGREGAIVFTSEGAKVCVADVDLALAEETVTLCPEGSAFAVRANVANEDDVKAMYAVTAERFGGIDVLYNNAGISPADDDSILVTEADARDRVQDVNTKGVYFCCKHGIPHLLERGGGSVINVASFVAILGAATSQISYSASKGAVLSMSRELAVQLRGRVCGSIRSARGRSRRPSCSASSVVIRQRSSGAGSTGRWGASRSRVRSSTAHCSSQAMSRRTSTGRRFSSTAG